MNATSDVGTASWIEGGINASVDYTIWVPKIKEGKRVGGESWEPAKPTNKTIVSIAGNNTISFDCAKLMIFSEVVKTEVQAVTILRAAEDGVSDLGDLKWHVYIAGSRAYPKTGDGMKFITSDDEWKEWVAVSNASKDKLCGISMVMQNPAVAHRKKRQNEALFIQAAKINRRHDRRVKRAKRTPRHRGLTAEEAALDPEADLSSSDDHSSKSGETTTTGGDTESDPLRLVADEIFKRHPIKSDYHQSIPVYVDPKDTNRFFYITAGMSRIWAQATIDHEARGSKVVTTDIPPKQSGIQWLSRTAEQLKRNKATPSSDSALNEVALMLKHVLGPLAQSRTDASVSSSGDALNASMSRYLKFCEIADPDGSIEDRLARAGFDQYSLFDQDYLPRQELVKLDLLPGVITRLYMKVKPFAKMLNEELLQ